MQNEMMHRPVVQDNVLHYLRHNQPLGISKATEEIKTIAMENNVPIIPEETVAFFNFFFKQRPVKNLLEIGTAYGYSASMFHDFLPDAHITTIERFDLMIDYATSHFQKYELTDSITLLSGQAQDILPTLETAAYDCIFMDCAKAKYVEFLPECLRLLPQHGCLMIDDVFQAGTVFEADETISRGARKIHKRLKQLLDVVHQTNGLTSSLLPLGDGLLMISKDKEDIVLDLHLD